MRKLVYTPFSIVFGRIGAIIGKRAFRAIWGRVSDEPKPPSPKEPDRSLGRVAAATAVARQLSVRAFHHLFGVWPVKRKQPS